MRVSSYFMGSVVIVRLREYVSDDSGVGAEPAVTLDATDITINANVKGSLRLRIVNAQGVPIRGFDFTDGPSIHGDSTLHPVKFKHELATLDGQAVCLEFSLQDAELYGFDLTRR